MAQSATPATQNPTSRHNRGTASQLRKHVRVTDEEDFHVTDEGLSMKTCHSCPSSPATNYQQTSLHCRATRAIHVASDSRTSFGTAVAKGFSYDLPQGCHLLGGRRRMAN